jgi:hypothetical protein
MGERNEEMARALAAQLHAVGIDARVNGVAVDWRVEVGVDGSRALRVRCVRNPAGSERTPRMRPGLSNARSVLQEVPGENEGPVYFVSLYASGVRVADGRTAAAQEVITCARGWLAGLELDQLVQEVPFVDADQRAMPAFAQRLDPQLRWEMAYPGSPLWIYGEGRRCEVRAIGATVVCNFLVGTQQVARDFAQDDLPAAVASWLIEHVSLGELIARAPGVELERHAEVLEVDPARWHWLHVLDRIADPDNVLAPLRELIHALSESPVATRFYSYSSHSQFCFSASSHFVWVNDGLPVVTLDEHDRILVNETPYDLQGAVQRIEEILAGYPIRPFFGSAAHHDLPLLAEWLARERSELRLSLVPHRTFTNLVVEDPAGQRRCTVAGTYVRFDTERRLTSASWPTREHAAHAVRRYCEAHEPAADIIADPATVVVMRDGVTIKGRDW